MQRTPLTHPRLHHGSIPLQHIRWGNYLLYYLIPHQIVPRKRKQLLKYLQNHNMLEIDQDRVVSAQTALLVDGEKRSFQQLIGCLLYWYTVPSLILFDRNSHPAWKNTTGKLQNGFFGIWRQRDLRLKEGGENLYDAFIKEHIWIWVNYRDVLEAYFDSAHAGPL